jgi:predicted component of type VI protein secretion system
MAKLIVTLDDAVIKEATLDKERVTIGRKAHNDIQIDSLAVSGEHALIVTILNDSFLEDLGSTNGTLVNGVPIKKHILNSDDVIEIGKYKLRFVSDAEARPTSLADFQKSMISRAAAPQTAMEALPAGFGDTQVNLAGRTQSLPSLNSASAGKPSERVGAVQVLTGPSAGKELSLVKNLTTLGKPGVQVAMITRKPHGYFLAHVEGTTFPVLNGKSIDAQPHPLNDHDVVELAGIKMEFFLKNA